ncbi:MAG: presenilin family intramembrane aspartyl protease [bacterium]|nr:presenilin family intramembrane aspartyl protease [bacterium]
MKELRLHLFLHTAILFSLSQGIALAIVDQLKSLALTESMVVTGELPFLQFLLFFFALTAFFLILLQLYKGHFFYRFVFFIAVFVGLLKVFELVFPLSLSIIVSGFFILGLLLLPLVWVHNLIVVLAGAGIGAVFGLQFHWIYAYLLLAILSFYDIIAVFITRHMVSLAQELIKRQATFALLVPQRWRDMRVSLGEVKPGSGFLILGGGDVVLPMIFLTSLYLERPQAVAGVFIGMIAGLFANHVILIRVHRPLPALPLITLGALGGILIHFFVTI